MSESKQKLSADDCDMLRSFANNGDAAGLIAFVEGRYAPVDKTPEPEAPKEKKARS